MAIHHGRIPCKVTPSRSVVVVAASYGNDGQLRNVIISGNDQQRYLDLDFPDEGVYVVYQDRAIQVAAPLCDKRKCYISHICSCDIPQFSINKSPHTRHSMKQRVVAWPVWKPCQCCLLNWLRLYQAAEAVNRLKLQFLRHPKTLTRTSLYDQQAFFYDTDIEERSIRSNSNGTFNRPTKLGGRCPPRVFEWMKDTWNEFVDSGCCKPRSITVIPENDDATYDEAFSAKERNNSEIDSDWDDLGIPYASSSTSNTTESEDYDLIDDLIETEFPKLQKNAVTSAKVDLSHSLTSNDSNVEDDDDPVPVIIPPKTMTMARDFGTATEPEKLTPVQIGHDSSTSVIESKHTPRSETALGTKRSYSDLVESEKRSSNLIGELSSRIKQQKRDIAKPTIRYRHRYSPIIRPSFIRVKRVPQRLLVT
ncbi:hypothetical protein K445DRAFT_20157 [Daldinia sp. EC12]|nr:hypothetical protein K445DRAFT_20157 [Daldinia sp. EC12]